MVSKLLEYTPGARLSSVEAMIHPFFDELRQEGARMPNGKEPTDQPAVSSNRLHVSVTCWPKQHDLTVVTCLRSGAQRAVISSGRCGEILHSAIGRRVGIG